MRNLTLHQLFNNIQVSNDRMLMANGQAMHEILKSSRQEAALSLQLAYAMKKDSVAMKTVCSAAGIQKNRSANALV
jgi:hypothetical protein